VRGRGWALWKALITFAGNLDTDINVAATARCVLDDVIAEHQRLAGARGHP
jgi:aminoglycoside phosphotransferase (APT) family kinase protein